MKLQILIVDDEPKIFQGVKRVLWTTHPDWEVHYASDGTQGISYLASHQIDVLVSDYKMPLMDGATFLSFVVQNYPNIIRVVLTGQCEQQAAYQLVKTSHLFLQKPTDTITLIDYVERAIRLKTVLNNPAVAKIINGLNSLPTVGNTYMRLSNLLSSELTHMDEVLSVISEDPSLIIKVMQIANSAYFNVSWNVTNLTQAINVMGFDALKALVLTHGLLRQFSVTEVGTLNLIELSYEIVQLGMFTKFLAKSEPKTSTLAEDAFVAGALIKIGLVITATSMKQDMERVIKLCLQENISYEEAEKLVLGCNHADIAAYLMAIWGLPPKLIEAVAFHLKPSACSSVAELPLLEYVHVASCIFREVTKLKPNIHAVPDGDLFKAEDAEAKWAHYKKKYEDFQKLGQQQKAG